MSLARSKMNSATYDSATKEQCQLVPKTLTAFDIYQNETRNSSVLTTTIDDDFDEILRNVIIAGRITEFAGLPGTAKTQICFHLCVSVPFHFPNYEAIYIDTNRNFAAHRLKEIAKHLIDTKTNSFEKKVDADEILKQVYHQYIENVAELSAFFKKLRNNWLKNHPKIKLLVIDSIAYPLRYVNISERTSLVCELFQELRSLANSYQFAIVITNDLIMKIGAANNVHQTPAFGDSFYHLVNSRVLLTKQSPNHFKATIMKSVDSDVRNVQFSL